MSILEEMLFKLYDQKMFFIYQTEKIFHLL